MSDPTPLSPAATVASLERILATVDRVGFDSEGQQWPTCLGFATSPTDVVVVDCLILKDKPYAAEVWQLCRAIIESPSIVKFVWNAPHERAFLASTLGWRLRRAEDAMKAWHEAFPELPKGLKYAASLLTRLPCWTEGVHWGEDDEERPAISGEKLFVYNCLSQDSLVITEEGNTPIGKLVKQKRQVRVLSYNEAANKVEWKPVTNWFRKPDRKVSFLRITIAGNKNDKPLICTPEHKVLTLDDGWLLASELKVGDRVYVDERMWTPEQRGTILGTFLGDSSIGQTSNPAKSYGQCTQISESLPTLKAQLFGGTITRALKSSGYVNQARPVWTWYMPACRQLEHLRQELSGPITHRLLDELTPQGIALWFMDDGCKQKMTNKGGSKGHIIFCLQGFTPPERLTIKDWFSQHYGNCSLSAHGNLSLGVYSSERLCCQMGPYILPDYRYKLSHPAPDWDPTNSETFISSTPMWDRIASIEPYQPPGTRRGYKVRYCIEVADNHNFFTPSGLVANSMDCLATYQLAIHLQLARIMNIDQQRQ